MFKHLGKAFVQLGDPKMSWVVFASLGAALALMIALIFGAIALIENTAVFEAWYLRWAVSVAGGLAAVLTAWFLFPGTAIVISTMFLESVSRAVEARHYPHLPAPREQSLATEILPELLKFLAVVILVNLIALPFYLVLWWLLGLGFVIAWLINGYLLGREYMEMVAMRRMTPREAKDFRRANAGACFTGGFIIAVLASVPFVNLLTPVIATAFMTHLFEDIRGRKTPQRSTP
ncbi:MAG: EI24 domain-containing protein [Alphaproteobacteria bacterium]